MARLHADALWLLFAAPADRPRSLPSGGEASDEELVGRAKQGDPGAMKDLYQRHADGAYSRLTRLIGPDPDREDLLQEVFIALFSRLGAFRGEASLRTYVYRIVANKAYDHLKAKARFERRRSRDTASEAESQAPSPETRALGQEDAVLFWSSLAQLKPKKRIAFILRVVEGLSLKEISEQVGASVHTVAQRIRHAKMELIALVREHEQDAKEQR